MIRPVFAVPWWRKSVDALLVVLAVVGAAISPAAAQIALLPGELLQSVERALPVLEQAKREVDLASGQVEESRGAFDLSFRASSKAVRGFYDNERATALLQQPLAPLGITTFGGYRAGRGLFATYDTLSQTLSKGELTAGFELPLLRNRSIDARRANRDIADFGLGVAQRGLDKARLSYYKDSLYRYWDWVASGQQERVARALLDIAEARDQQLADSVALGQVAPVERTDNRRAILQRRSAVVTATRQVEMKAIDLSLYYRALDGMPERPRPDRLPELPRPQREDASLDETALVQLALGQRPELLAVRLKRSQQEVELRLAQNAVLPSFDLFAQGSRDFGAGSRSLVASVFEGGVTFSVPLQNRRATGKQAQVSAKLGVIVQELRWAEDHVRADVQDAISAVRAARGVLDVISEELAVARELEGLERARFDLGDSTQFLVNLRELATADAAFREAKALADYQKALVTLDAATGSLLNRVPRS